MMKPITVVHLVGQIGIGGGEKQLCELIVNSPPEFRHKVFYFNDLSNDEGLKLYARSGIEYTKIPRNKRRPIKFLRDFSMAIRQSRPDIVHCWLFSANIWGRLAALLAGHKKIIVAFRSGILRYSPFFYVLEFFTKNKVYHLANSRACATMTALKSGVRPEKYEVIYNGVDLARFQEPPCRDRLRNELNLPLGTKLITMVGRLTEAKNYPMLLRTAKRCREQNLPVHFVIVGHGERETELKALAEELNVAGTVHFLGLRTDVPQVLAASDLFYYTSNWEGFPNALLEAMATGLPVITTDFDGVKELVTGPDVGTIVPLNDAEAAVTAIRNCLENPERADAVGRNAQRFIQATFAMSVMVEKTIAFYHKLLEQ